jgi:hypothetical protein
MLLSEFLRIFLLRIVRCQDPCQLPTQVSWTLFQLTPIILMFWRSLLFIDQFPWGCHALSSGVAAAHNLALDAFISTLHTRQHSLAVWPLPTVYSGLSLLVIVRSFSHTWLSSCLLLVLSPKDSLLGLLSGNSVHIRKIVGFERCWPLCWRELEFRIDLFNLPFQELVLFRFGVVVQLQLVKLERYLLDLLLQPFYLVFMQLVPLFSLWEELLNFLLKRPELKIVFIFLLLGSTRSCLKLG